MESGNILIVDDDHEIADLVGIHLRGEGYNVYKAYNGNDALDIFDREEIDLAILDIMMPGMDGNEVCAKIREHSTIPIIMLSAKDSENDKVSGLVNGADDYVTKPFSPKELMARVHAVLARSAPAVQNDVSPVLTFGGLTIDIPGRSVSVDGNKIELTPKEYDLLFYLVENKNIALSRDKLLRDVWGYDFFGDDRTIDTHIKNLRNNLGPYRDMIVTLRGVGYKFETEN